VGAYIHSQPNNPLRPCPSQLALMPLMIFRRLESCLPFGFSAPHSRDINRQPLVLHPTNPSRRYPRLDIQLFPLPSHPCCVFFTLLVHSPHCRSRFFSHMHTSKPPFLHSSTLRNRFFSFAPPRFNFHVNAGLCFESPPPPLLLPVFPCSRLS